MRCSSNRNSGCACRSRRSFAQCARCAFNDVSGMMAFSNLGTLAKPTGSNHDCRIARGSRLNHKSPGQT
ncbi:hypothetical protein BCEN4_440116 [Burkholderia cenocepacia]|nr:hypothetical protein BCEN4_440116 [Burkholderia cenocepacia]